MGSLVVGGGGHIRVPASVLCSLVQVAVMHSKRSELHPRSSTCLVGLVQRVGVILVTQQITEPPLLVASDTPSVVLD